MTSDEKDQLLDRYVTGRPMNAAEEEQVKQLIANDLDFRTEYKLRQELIEAGIRQRRAAWAEQQKIQPLPPKQSAFPFQWAAAAAVVLLLGLGAIWWMRVPDDQPSMSSLPVYEQHDAQVGFIKPGEAAVGNVIQIITLSTKNEYRFSSPDTLQIFTPDPEYWKGQQWQLVRLSEVRYVLQKPEETYTLEQGRSLRLPLTKNE